MNEPNRKSPRFFLTKPTFGGDYTKRQLSILNDDIPIEQIRTTELATIMKKAKVREDTVNFEIAQGLYDFKMHPCTYMPCYSMAESRHILESLTPWKIDWETDNTEDDNWVQ